MPVELIQLEPQDFGHFVEKQRCKHCKKLVMDMGSDMVKQHEPTVLDFLRESFRF